LSCDRNAGPPIKADYCTIQHLHDIMGRIIMSTPFRNII